MIASLSRATGWSSRAPTARARRRAMFAIFGRADPVLLQMPPAQLVRLVRRLVAHDAGLVVTSHDVATAAGMHIRDITKMAPGLCRELDDRLHKKYVAPWPLVFETPAPSWENTMSKVHAALYRTTWTFGVQVDDLLTRGELSSSLAALAETEPAVLAPERWRVLADVLPTRLREIANAKARAMGAADAAGAPLAMVSAIEDSPIEELLNDN